MRRTWAMLLVCGCFGEPDRVESTTNATMTTEAVEESSSSSDAGASSSEGVEESESSSTGFDPRACPEWCTEACDGLLGFERCRCTNDAICELGGLQCHVPESGGVGHCY